MSEHVTLGHAVMSHVSLADTSALPRWTREQPSSSGARDLHLYPLGSGPAPTAMGPQSLARTLLIGRAPACDLMLDQDAAASRNHAQIVPIREGIEVTDLESFNGTYVDGRAVTRTVARAGSVLRVGSTVFVVSASSRSPVDARATDASLVGGSSLDPVRRLISLVGPTDLAVLILGETGTGKEVVARLLHAAGDPSRQFIAVNCAALPESLVESELFGHAAGAFTGAQKQRRGLFQLADGGTLFLDEIGDLPLSAQAKLLRVLEDGVVRPVGSERDQRVQVRILSATNRDLTRDIADGRFRADLYARLAAVEARLPPLRSRIEDLPALFTHLLSRRNQGALRFEPDALEAMALYDWPQNVRELDNVLKALAVVAEQGQVRLESLPDRIRERLSRARQGVGATRPEATNEVAPRAVLDVPEPREGREPCTRGELEQALRLHDGNVRRAAAALSLSRAHVYRLLERWNLEPNAFRAHQRAGTRVAKTGAR